MLEIKHITTLLFFYKLSTILVNNVQQFVNNKTITLNPIANQQRSLGNLLTKIIFYPWIIGLVPYRTINNKKKHPVAKRRARPKTSGLTERRIHYAAFVLFDPIPMESFISPHVRTICMSTFMWCFLNRNTRTFSCCSGPAAISLPWLRICYDNYMCPVVLLCSRTIISI